MRGPVRWTSINTLIGALMLLPSSAVAEVVELTRGHFVLDERSTPPPFDAAVWEAIELPDEWAESRPGDEGNGWYRFEVPKTVAPGSEPLAVYLPEFNMDAAVWINGEPVGECGPFGDPVAWCWNTPMIVSVAPSLLSRDVNSVDIRLHTYEPFGGLSPVMLGPESELLPHFERQRFRQVTAPRLFTMLAVVVIVFMLMLAAGTRDSVYAYFGLAVFAWVVAMLNNWVQEIFLPMRMWQWVVHAAFDWLGPLFVLFTHRLVDLKRPRVDRFVVGVGVASNAATLIVANDAVAFHYVSTATHVCTLLIGVYAQVALVSFCRRLTAVQRIFFVVGGGAAIVLGTHDTLIQLGALGRGASHLMAFAAPILTSSFAVILTIRFLQTFNRARHLNVELEDRVQEKQREIEASFDQLHRAERDRAVAEERARIMREVHDGIGGSLVSTLALIENRQCSIDEIGGAIRGAIDDMRIVIDSLDTTIEDLATLLGLIRGRSEPAIRKAGFRFDWQVSDLPPVPRFGPEQLLHVLRIVQEAITNIIKHSKGEVITVVTGMTALEDGSAIRIEIRDDGTGLQTRNRGHGLRNMVERAQLIDARLEVEDARPGTRVCLVIPLDATPGQPASRAITRPGESSPD